MRVIEILEALKSLETLGRAGDHGGVGVYIHNVIHFAGELVVYQIGPGLQSPLKGKCSVMYRDFKTGGR